jgi:predicted Na+-dependent transporter
MDWIPLFSQTVNTVVLGVLAVGLYLRHRPSVHIPLMLTSFVVDLGNVLLVEFYARTRGKGAVEQGIDSFTEGGRFIEQFHILVSVLCILGYVVAVFTGRRLYRHQRGRKAHKINAAVFVFTRLTSYVTSFWMGA